MSLLLNWRKRVTSKGGTTERAIATFDEANMQQIFAQALAACAARGQELANDIGTAGVKHTAQIADLFDS